MSTSIKFKEWLIVQPEYKRLLKRWELVKDMRTNYENKRVSSTRK